MLEKLFFYFIGMAVFGFGGYCIHVAFQIFRFADKQ